MPGYHVRLPPEIVGPVGPVRPPRRIPVVVTAQTPEKARAWQVRLAAGGAPWIYRRGEALQAGDVPAIACYIDDHDVLMSWAAPAADPAAVRASLQYRSYAREQWMAANERVMDVEVRHRVWDNALSTLLDEGFQVLHRPGDVNYLRFTDRERHVDWRVAADIVSTIIRRECQGIGLI